MIARVQPNLVNFHLETAGPPGYVDEVFLRRKELSRGGPVQVDPASPVEITSPNWPSNYGDNENVVWSVTVPEGHVVGFQIEEMEVS